MTADMPCVLHIPSLMLYTLALFVYLSILYSRSNPNLGGKILA